MKKNTLAILGTLIIIVILIIVKINMNSKEHTMIKKQNSEYEKYLKDEIYGTDLITLINKAINSNESNDVEKDEKGNFINNNLNSINIDVVMITDEEKQETKAYRMEAISKVGISSFITNFNTVKFKCTKLEYHKNTGKIKYIELTQQTI